MSMERIPFTGLWEHVKKNGEPYLAANIKLGIGMYRLLAFPNNNKRPGDSQPLYHCYLAPQSPESKPTKEPEPWELPE